MTFVSPNDSTDRPAVATIDQHGKLKPPSFMQEGGIAPGEYRVVISSLISSPDIDRPNEPKVFAPQHMSAITHHYRLDDDDSQTKRKACS